MGTDMDHKLSLHHQDFTVDSVQIVVMWVVTPCSLVGGCQRSTATVSFLRPNLFASCNNTFSKWWEVFGTIFLYFLSRTDICLREYNHVSTQETTTSITKCTYLYIGPCKNLSDIYLQSQLRNFIDVIISLCITTCFGPYGPSSGEYNYYV
jgi:hypothetical protein